VLRVILNSHWAFWLVLALPALPMLIGHASGSIEPTDLLRPSGETSARLMIVAMMLGPLMAVIGARPWLRWLVARRRYLGVAAFAYALLHLGYYVLDMGNVADMLAELGAPGIWTGWAALALMLPLALTSNDAAMRALRAGWKRVQRLAYPAALLLLLHWVLVHNNPTAALVHFTPLIVLQLLRLFRPSRLQPKGYSA
jgi:methionine sulfoxide reductase heme-binding subunit